MDTQPAPTTQEIHGVVFLDRASNQYVAICLEYGVVTQGDSEDHAFEMLREAVELHIEDAPPQDEDWEYQPVDSEPVIRKVLINAEAVLNR